jgi:hypothetical protein
MKRREVAEKAGFTRASSDWKESSRKRKKACQGRIQQEKGGLRGTRLTAEKSVTSCRCAKNS